jgi:hypothetical protein
MEDELATAMVFTLSTDDSLIELTRCRFFKDGEVLLPSVGLYTYGHADTASNRKVILTDCEFDPSLDGGFFAKQGIVIEFHDTLFHANGANGMYNLRLRRSSSSYDYDVTLNNCEFLNNFANLLYDDAATDSVIRMKNVTLPASANKILTTDGMHGNRYLGYDGATVLRTITGTAAPGSGDAGLMNSGAGSYDRFVVDGVNYKCTRTGTPDGGSQTATWALE